MHAEEVCFEKDQCVQRCESMAALLKQHGAQTVLDVGCGAGRLVEHLFRQVILMTYLRDHQVAQCVRICRQSIKFAARVYTFSHCVPDD